jgi:hypothetical protein
MNKIDVTEKVNWQHSWEEDELIGLQFCPECKFNFKNDYLLISIEEPNAYECINCHTKFTFSKKITVFKLEDGPIAQQ